MRKTKRIVAVMGASPALLELVSGEPAYQGAASALGEALTKELKFGHRALSIHGPLFETQMTLTERS